jgi:molybdenum cofactor cytidylyltransferase
MVGALLGYAGPGIDLLSSKAADELGPAGSLAFAVSRFEPGAVTRAVVVTPVDTPPSSKETVAQLLARLDAEGESGPPLAVRPRYQGRHGHPVVLRPEALDRYLAPNPPPLRDHLATLGDRVVSVDVDDPAVLLDLDTPSDVVKLLGSMPRFLTGG